MEAVNTPGLFYAIAYWISCGLIFSISPRKQPNRWFLAIMIIFLVLISLVMHVTDGNPDIFLPMMLFYILMIFLTTRIVTKFDTRTSAYFTVHAFIIGELIASLGWQILFYLNLTDIIWLSFSVYLIFLAPLIAGCIYWFIKQFKSFNATLIITSHEMIAVIIMGIAIFTLSNLSYAVGSSMFSSTVTYVVFLIRTLFDLAGVAILNAYHFQLAQLKTRIEYDRIQQLFQMQHQNYQTLEHSIEVINQKYHDLKYQIAVLRSGINSKDSLDYLDQMEKDIGVYEAKNDTGNKMLDTILTAKAIYCHQHDIELNVIADGSLLSFMQPFDLSTMFGNMIDNAIESVQKIETKEKRLIHLLIAKERGFIRIRMENTYEGDVQFEDELPKTTKKDPLSHGYGLKSIRSIVERYEGSMTINMQKGWFELRILIPLQVTNE